MSGFNSFLKESVASVFSGPKTSVNCIGPSGDITLIAFSASTMFATGFTKSITKLGLVLYAPLYRESSVTSIEAIVKLAGIVTNSYVPELRTQLSSLTGIPLSKSTIYVVSYLRASIGVIVISFLSADKEHVTEAIALSSSYNLIGVSSVKEAENLL